MQFNSCNSNYKPIYWPALGNPSDEVKALSIAKGAKGLGIYYAIMSKLSTCDNFIFHFNIFYKLDVFLNEYKIREVDFREVVAFMAYQVALLDIDLYEKGYFFSEALIQQLYTVGILADRKIMPQEIFAHVQELKGFAHPVEERDRDDDELPF